MQPNPSRTTTQNVNEGNNNTNQPFYIAIHHIFIVCHLGHTKIGNPNYYINDWYSFPSSSLVSSNLINYYNKVA